MQKVKITQIFKTNKDKNGNILKNKDGREYTRMSIKIEGNESWISGFENKDNSSWKEGDEVVVNIEKVTQGDKVYLNFKNPSELDSLRAVVEDLEKRVKSLEILSLPPTEDLTEDFGLGDDDVPDFG